MRLWPVQGVLEVGAAGAYCRKQGVFPCPAAAAPSAPSSCIPCDTYAPPRAAAAPPQAVLGGRPLELNRAVNDAVLRLEVVAMAYGAPAEDMEMLFGRFHRAGGQPGPA